MEVEKALSNQKLTDLETLSLSVKKGIFDIKSDTYVEQGIPFIRISNLKEMKLDLSNVVFIPEEEHNKNLATRLFENDIVLSKTAYPAASLVHVVECNASQDIIAIRISPNSRINPFFIVVYLNTKYGYLQMKRWFTGNIQMHLNLSDAKALKIPEFSDHFQISVKKLFHASLRTEVNSKQAYAEAEAVLLDELGLADFTPSTDAVSIKTFSDSFGSTGRLDAEYYQPKYDDYLKLIKQYQGGFKPLSKACNLKDQGYNPLEKEEYRYIELSDIGNVGEVKGCTESLGEDLPSRARRKVQTGDVLVSSIEGSLGSCALVPSLYNNALCSTGFYVVASNEINPETLLVLFKSEPMQSILKQNCSGTILTAVNKQEFLGIPIPIINITQQRRIADLVERSFTLKAQSEALLAIAKRGVELAIESNEASAQAWMLEQSGGLLVSPSP